jgi:signal transduction histidine kinase
MDGVAPEERCLRVRTFMAHAGAVCVAVTDSGIGFNDETAGNLFTAFYTTKESGMGMGLSICRSIVEAGGGRIWATRNEGPGATFSISLPAEDAA